MPMHTCPAQDSRLVIQEIQTPGLCALVIVVGLTFQKELTCQAKYLWQGQVAKVC